MLSSCIYGTEGEPPKCMKETFPRARKTHQCCECGEEIPINGQYQKVTGIWDNTPDSFTTCLTCFEIRNILFCDGYTFRYLWADLYESCREDLPWSLVAKLSDKAKIKLCDWWDKLKE